MKNLVKVIDVVPIPKSNSRPHIRMVGAAFVVSVVETVLELMCQRPSPSSHGSRMLVSDFVGERFSCFIFKFKFYVYNVYIKFLIERDLAYMKNEF